MSIVTKGLLQEIKDELSLYNKTLDDIVWVWCGDEVLTSGSNFVEKMQKSSDDCYFAVEAQTKGITVDCGDFSITRNTNTNGVIIWTNYPRGGD